MFQLILQQINSSAILLCITLSLLYCVYSYVLLPTFISPLAKIPNVHFTSPFNSFWIKRRNRQGATGVREIQKAHQKHGPVIRVSPNELSVCSLDGLRKAYSGGWEKTPWYNAFQNYGTPNLVSTVPNRPHSIQKRMISNVYSKSFIQNSSDLAIISRLLLHDRLFPILENAIKDGADFDAYQLNQGLGADFMNAFLFGTANGTDFIRDAASLSDFMEPFSIKFRDLPGKEEAGKKVEDHILAMCRAAEGVSAPLYDFSMSLSPTQPVVYSQLFSRLAKEASASVTPPRIIVASEMLDQIVAAIETTRVALTYAQWELSQRPDLDAALRKELLTLSPPIMPDINNTIPPELPDPKSLDALPLLNAILKEVLRLYTPSPGMFPRMTPREGAVIDGYVIPGGVSVAASAYCLHRNEEVYPDANSFKPERWLKNEGSMGTKTEQDKWYWAFGSGGRMCIGSHYAIYTLKLCIAAIYTNYSTSIVDDEGIEQEDAFISGPKGDKLVLRFHSLSRQ